MNVWCFEDLRRFSYRYISAILLLGSRRIPISEIVGSRSGIEPWPLALQAQELNHYTIAAPHDNEGWTNNLCFFLSLSICSKKNKGVFVKHYGMPPAATKSEKAIFNFKVKVKITRSLTLVSFERASLVEYVCPIWSLYLLQFKNNMPPIIRSGGIKMEYWNENFFIL